MCDGIKDDSDARLLLGIYLFPLLTNGLAKVNTSLSVTTARMTRTTKRNISKSFNNKLRK